MEQLMYAGLCVQAVIVHSFQPGPIADGASWKLMSGSRHRLGPAHNGCLISIPSIAAHCTYRPILIPHALVCDPMSGLVPSKTNPPEPNWFNAIKMCPGLWGCVHSHLPPVKCTRPRPVVFALLWWVPVEDCFPLSSVSHPITPVVSSVSHLMSD